MLRGEGWFVGPRCGARVWVSQREAHGFRVGSARVRDNGTFSFSHAVPREARRGTRIVLDVTQYCDGVGTSRTVRLRIGRDRHGCGGPLSVDETAYDLTVFGGLGCDAGANAIGAFIDTRISRPAGPARTSIGGSRATTSPAPRSTVPDAASWRGVSGRSEHTRETLSARSAPCV